MSTKTRPASAEEILAHLQEMQRQEWAVEGCGEVTPEASLSLDTTIRDWRIMDDSLWFGCETNSLARWLNACYGTSIPFNEWDRVLAPVKRKTLRGVCDLLAAHVQVPVIEPYAVLGSRCLPAGYFVHLRDKLAFHGADVSSLRPSSSLYDVNLEHLGILVCESALIAPGRMPRLHCPTPTRIDTGGMFGLTTGMLGVCLMNFYWQAVSLCCLGILILGASVTRRLLDRENPSPIFGELRTFRDLAKCLAAEPITAR
ncbi:MAG: hypothetical protein AB7N71_05720 [Phycisphaerae bacterium]